MDILNVSPYGIYPPTSGGFIRIHNLNLELSKYSNVFLFSQGIRKFELKYPLNSWITKINENYTEYRFVNKLSIFSSYFTGVLNIPPVFTGNVLTAVNPKILNKYIENCDLIQVEHPWQFHYVFKKKPSMTPIILSEQNVEFDLLKQALVSESLFSKKLYRIIKEKEAYAVENSDSIFVTSTEDMKMLIKEFSVPKDKIHLIPNGVDLSVFHPPNIEDKEKIKKILGLSEKKVILFTGSKFVPNILAVNEILKIAEEIKDENVMFIVAGSVGNSFKSRKNVLFTGYVEDISDYFKIADIAINPMISGSGTNLKILEYLSSGIPTITTKTGARGHDFENGKHVIISEIVNFPNWINILLNDLDLCAKLKKNGQELVTDCYDWKQIAKTQIKIYEKLCGY